MKCHHNCSGFCTEYCQSKAERWIDVGFAMFLGVCFACLALAYFDVLVP